ncbi:hypothetical protein Salat_1168800 [Sesamum alatum]|uniref:ZCF37 n=1 Tax=Sesamum alatum TaxID=300844 RepID=A0AAE2CNI2_9LAMI|nr:hypothetical protein Salat_1168800 [Sesamum alatum]
MFICGSGSFGHEDNEELYGSPSPTPKRSKRTTSFCKIIGKDSSNKNPYADRGLDKFYALLADLDDKKQKIYTQRGSEDISFVRFVYTNDSDQVKPIIVKVKEKKQEKSSPNNNSMMIKHSHNNNTATMNQAAVDHAADQDKVAADQGLSKEESGGEKTRKKKRCLRCNASFNLRLHPWYYFPVVVVLILLFLAINGRSFAILCTSIGWYLVPSISGGTSSSSIEQRKPKRKKEYVRKLSEKKMMSVHSEGPSSPKSVINGLSDNKKQQHGHRRSL